MNAWLLVWCGVLAGLLVAVLVFILDSLCLKRQLLRRQQDWSKESEERQP